MSIGINLKNGTINVFPFLDGKYGGDSSIANKLSAFVYDRPKANGEIWDFQSGNSGNVQYSIPGYLFGYAQLNYNTTGGVYVPAANENPDGTTSG
jgi:hypothetical protein